MNCFEIQCDPIPMLFFCPHHHHHHGHHHHSVCFWYVMFIVEHSDRNVCKCIVLWRRGE